jgi:hypothetical protein
MKRTLSVLMALAFLLTGYAQNTATKTADVQSFKAGGTPIVIPSPATNMMEVGYDIRELMEAFVPGGNRLLAGFLMAKDIPKFKPGYAPPVLTKYAMVQVPRRGEFMDVEARDFPKVVASIKQEFGAIDTSSTYQNAEEELKLRMKSMNIDANIGKPVPLGTLFSKTDAYGFGLIQSVSVGSNVMKVAMGGAVVRVKKRVLFVYLYSEYQSEESVLWLRKTTEQWADAMLNQNL